MQLPRRGSGGQRHTGRRIQESGQSALVSLLHLRTPAQQHPVLDAGTALRRRRPGCGRKRHDPMVLLQEHGLRRGERIDRIPQLHAPLRSSDRRCELRLLFGHPLRLYIPRPHPAGSRHLGDQPARVAGRSLVSDRLFPLGPAGVLRSDRHHGPRDFAQRRRNRALQAAQHVRRVRRLHRGVLRQGHRDAPAAPAEHPLVRPRIGSRSPRIQGPHAALRRQPALQRQQRVLLPPAQLRRHLPGQPDIRSRQMGAGPHRGGAGHKLRRAERLPALRESGQRVDRRQLRTGCPKLPRLLRRTGIQHRRISVRLRPHRRSQEDPAALRHPHRTPLLGR